MRCEGDSGLQRFMKILFLVTNDWYFWLHRLALARALRDAGAEIFVMTRLNEHRAALESEGFRVIPWKNISSRSVNLFREAKAFWEVLLVYRRLSPDLTHHIALKPALYGGMAAVLSGGLPTVQTIAGLGYLFTNPPRRMLWVRWLLVVCLWIIQRLGKPRTIFQNPDDRDFFVSAGLVRADGAALIRGSGVNLHTFSPMPEPSGIPVVALPARMLWDKGIREFVEAAKQIHFQGLKARFALAGRVDGSPGRVSEEQLRSWAEAGIVEWWGYEEDVRVVFSRSNIVCLPSYYREGLPKVLLEAAACERAVVTTNSPGCREVVREGENGVLVPPRDTRTLVTAIRILLEDPALRARMGKRGREIVEQEFSESLVIQQTLALYRQVLNGRWPSLNSASPEETLKS